MAEQNELLMKNHQSCLTSSTPLSKANEISFHHKKGNRGHGHRHDEKKKTFKIKENVLKILQKEMLYTTRS